MSEWVDKSLKATYLWEMDVAITCHGIKAKELKRLDIGDLRGKAACMKAHELKVAYFRGILRGIKDADQMKEPIIPAGKDNKE